MALGVITVILVLLSRRWRVAATGALGVISGVWIVLACLFIEANGLLPSEIGFDFSGVVVGGLAAVATLVGCVMRFVRHE